MPRHVRRGLGTEEGARGHWPEPSARSPESKLSSFQAQDQTLEGAHPWRGVWTDVPQVWLKPLTCSL